jgi:hypothetical protein
VHRRGRARVGRLVRCSLHAGTVRFAVALNAAARRALRTHRRLVVTAKITVESPQGVRESATRRLVLRP